MANEGEKKKYELEEVNFELEDVDVSKKSKYELEDVDYELEEVSFDKEPVKKKDESSQEYPELSKEAPSMDSSNEGLAPNVPEEIKGEVPKDGFKSMGELETHNRKQDRKANILRKEYTEKAAKDPDTYLDPELHKQIRTLFEKEGFEGAQTDRFLKDITDTAEKAVEVRDEKEAKSAIMNHVFGGKPMEEMVKEVGEAGGEVARDESLIAEKINAMNDEELTALRDDMSRAQIPLEAADQVINSYKTEHIQNEGVKRAMEDLNSPKPDPTQTEGMVLGSAESLKMKEDRDADIEKRKEKVDKEISTSMENSVPEEYKAIAKLTNDVEAVEKEIAALGDSPADLIKKNELSIEKNYRADMLKEMQAEAGMGNLYDPETGQYLSRDEASDEQKKNAEDVDKLAAQFQGTDKDKLKKVYSQVHFETKAIEDKYTAKTIPMTHYSGATKMVSPQDISTGAKRFALEQNEYSFDEKDIEEAERLRTQYVDSKKKQTALARSLVLNEDVTKLGERGFVDKLEIMGGAFMEETGLLNEEDMTNEDLRMGIGKALGEHGIELTEDQKEAMERTLLEEGSAAVGTSLPLMLPMGVLGNAVKGAKATSKAGRIARKAQKVMEKAFGKSGKFMYKVMEGAGEGALTFGATPSESVDWSMGIGEGGMQGALDGLEKMMPKKWGKLIPFMTRVAAGTTTETIQEFTGDYLSTLNKSGFNYDLAFEDTFGKDVDTFWDKLMVVGITSAMFSTAFNTPTLLAVQSEIKEGMPESALKNEYLAEIDKLLKSDPLAEKEAIEAQKAEVEKMEPGKDQDAQLKALDKELKAADKRIKKKDKDIEAAADRLATISEEEDAKKEAEAVKKAKEEAAKKVDKEEAAKLAEEEEIEKELEDVTPTEPTTEEQESTVLPEEPVETTEEKQEPTAEEGAKSEPVKPKDEKAPKTEKIAPTKAKTKSGLGKIMDKVFGVKDKKKNKAAVEIADRIISRMAKKEGISKMDMYDRISYAKGDKQTTKELKEGRKAKFQGKEGGKNYEAWKGEAAEMEGYEVQEKATTGSPVVIKAHHGTTNTFTEFDSNEKGTSDSHFGKLNYFTTDAGDANSNYAGEGPDLSQRIEMEGDRIGQDLEEEFSNEEGEPDVAAINEEFGLDEDQINEDMSFTEIGAEVARNRLNGGDPKVMDVYVKLNNPAVIGGGKNFVEDISEDMYEDNIPDATEEIMEEYDISKEEAESDYSWEIKARAIENSNIWDSPLREAIQKAVYDNTYDGDMGRIEEAMMDIIGNPEYDITEMADALREGAQFAEGEQGELMSGQIVAQTFKNLGYDGIIMTNPAQKFQGMGISQDTSHVHVFDEFNNQIKNSDGSNTLYGETADIRFQDERGAILTDEIEATIFALTDPDITTPLHELAHLYEKYLTPEEKQAIMEWAGHDTWTTETSEFFAQGFEQYLKDGKAPSPELKSIFDQFKEWLTDLVTGLPEGMELNDNMQNIYDDMLGVKKKTPKKKTSSKTKVEKIKEKQKAVQTKLKFQGKTESHEKKRKVLLTAIKKHLQSRRNVDEAEGIFERKSVKEIFEMAKKFIETEQIDPLTLVENLIESQRPASAMEVAVLLYHTNTLNKSIDKTLDQFEAATKANDGKKMMSAEIKLADLREEKMMTSVAATVTGAAQSISMNMRRFLVDSSYNLETQVNMYEKVSGKDMDTRMRKKFERLSKELEKVMDEQRKAETEQNEEELVDLKKRLKKDTKGKDKKNAIRKAQKTANEVAQEKKWKGRKRKKSTNETGKKYQTRAKNVAKKLRDVASNQDNPLHKALFGDPDFPVQKQGIAGMDVALKAAINAAADMIEAGGRMADAISISIEKLRDSDWYASTSVKNRKLKEEQILDYLEDIIDEEANVQEEGSETIYNDLIKLLVTEKDIKDINTLIDELKKMDNYKDLPRANIRDMITNYGKTSQLSKDKIDKRIRKMKRIGKLHSALEDARGGKLPKRSGLQRDKPSQKERQLRKELDEAMKMVVPEESDLAQEETVMKSANTKTKNRIKNSIADMQAEIERVKAEVKKGATIANIKGKKRWDKEQAEQAKQDLEDKDVRLGWLRAKQQEMKEALSVLMGPNTLTEAQRSEMATRTLEKQLAEYDAMEKAGTFKEKRTPKPVRETTKLKQVREALAKAKEKYESRFLHKYPPKTAEEKAIDKRYATLLRMEKKLEDQLNGVKPPKKEDAPALTARELEVKARIENLREAIRETDEFKEKAASKRLENFGKRTEKKIAELERRLKDKDFAPKDKPTEVQWKSNPKLRALKQKEKELKKEFDFEQGMIEYKNRKQWEKNRDLLLEISAIPKTFKATLDMSGFFRQGDVFIKTASLKDSATIFKRMLGFFGSGKWAKDEKGNIVTKVDRDGKKKKVSKAQQRFENWHSQIENSRYYDLSQEAGLFLADDSDVKAQLREERFQSKLLKKFWLTRTATTASDRAYSGVLNSMRFNMWENAAQLMKDRKIDPDTKEGMEVYKGIASWINSATGRGGLWIFERSSTLMTMIFWAPRLIAGRLNMFNPVFYASMPKEARVWALKKAIKWMAIDAAMFTALGVGLGKEDEDDELYFEINPFSSDFAKIRAGDIRYDLFGGTAQYMRMIIQQLYQKKMQTSTGEYQHFGRGYNGPTWGSELFTFFANKAAPIPGTVYRNFLTRKESYDPLTDESTFMTSYGDPINYWNELVFTQVTPLIVEEAYSMYNEVGVGQGLATVAATFFGMGAQHYSQFSGPLKRQFKNTWKLIDKEQNKQFPDREKIKFLEKRAKKIEAEIQKKAEETDRKVQARESEYEAEQEEKFKDQEEAEEKRIRNQRNK